MKTVRRKVCTQIRLQNHELKEASKGKDLCTYTISYKNTQYGNKTVMIYVCTQFLTRYTQRLTKTVRKMVCTKILTTSKPKDKGGI